MRAYRKRRWSPLAVNMTPLIDVVFLIIIFFIIMINFSEMHIRKINFPKADETRASKVDKRLKIPLVIKSENMVFLDRTKIEPARLSSILKSKDGVPRDLTMVIQADENVPFSVIKTVMRQLSNANVAKIEFSTLKDSPDGLQED